MIHGSVSRSYGTQIMADYNAFYSYFPRKYFLNRYLNTNNMVT